MKSPLPGADPRLSAQLFSLSSLGFVLVVCIALGLGVGIFLDRRFGSHPACTLVFLVLGIIAGFYQVIKEILSIDAHDRAKKNP